MAVQIARRMQSQRSSDTRQRLRSAALECLSTIGYGHTTLTEISRRAGLTRGALNHHYQGKNDLLLDVVDQIWSQIEEDLRNIAESSKNGQLNVTEVVDEMWHRIFNNRNIFSSLEMVIASRGDPALHDPLVKRAQQLFDSYEKIGGKIFTATGMSQEDSRSLLNMTLSFLRGLAVQSIYSRDPAITNQSLLDWKKAISILIQQQSTLAA